MLANQPKTFPEPLLTPMYARTEKLAQKATAAYGRPLFDVRVKIFGALPTIARPSTQSINKIGSVQIMREAHTGHETTYTSH